MNKLFSIAKEVTNPYSLAALFFLILYSLYDNILTKIGIQSDEHGYKIIKLLMVIVAIVAVVTLILVFSLKIYKVYKTSDDTGTLDKVSNNLVEMKEKVELSTNEINLNVNDSKEEIIGQQTTPKLKVNIYLSKFSGANVYIGNNGGGIILVKNFTAYWNYKKCPFFRPSGVGAPLIQYKYELTLTKTSGSKLIEHRIFKYGNGDIDDFYIDINYPDYGVYEIWFEFDYQIFGQSDWNIYKTEKQSIELCEK
jgi:hypothetical protein